ncbi:MAG: AMP-binding protein [Rickettsiales bacterium]|nr:AMP-binding protein [Rickettsiales bacterium]
MTTVISAIRQASKIHGATQVIAGDLTVPEMNYRQLFMRSLILSHKLAPRLRDQPYVGLMLPNALAAVVTFVAMHLLGRVPCMLNFSAGEANIVHACKIANVKTVLTSRTFIEKAKLESVAEALEKHVAVIYLEDVRETLNLADKLRGALRYALGTIPDVMSADAPAVVLYTSGSEGAPKGVVLSHNNIAANLQQACKRLDLFSSDVVFNALPVFHSFGLTIGMLLPLVRGFKTFLYPSPVHYKLIPKLIHETGSTIMVGTDTFYNGYATYAKHEYFTKIRLAVAGAEKLKETTRQHWENELGVTILQGYGVTETSPVISVNIPTEHKPGTVGKALPDIECRLEPVEGLDHGGRLLVKGPNIMLGYLKADQPGVIQPQGEWYDTGDIVDIDAQGYLSILGRAKRFAKIAGEMVSLAAVEDLAHSVSAQVSHAAVTIPDERKGEQIILFSEDAKLSRASLLEQAKKQGVSELCLPRQVIHLEEIPRLATGKIDYPVLTKQAVKS